MEEERLKAILESLLFAAGEPVSLAQLTNAIDNVARDEIRKALGEMMTAYAGGPRGIAMEEVAGGYQLRTPREHAFYVRRLLAAKPPRLSRPLLETLAIVAYRQPITRPEIEQLRGVDSGGVLDTLVERGLVKIAGRKEAPGRPMMYATTPAFLEVFGLKDIDSLPDLEEFRALAGSAQAEARAEHLRDEGPREENVEFATAPEGEAEPRDAGETESSVSESGTVPADNENAACGEAISDCALIENVEAAPIVETEAEIELEDAARPDRESSTAAAGVVNDNRGGEASVSGEPEGASARDAVEDAAPRGEGEEQD
ncbi:MAG: SMC-Scp complex subunit ScpB [Candidatus Binataceae bacterium]